MDPECERQTQGSDSVLCLWSTPALWAETFRPCGVQANCLIQVSPCFFRNHGVVCWRRNSVELASGAQAGLYQKWCPTQGQLLMNPWTEIVYCSFITGENYTHLFWIRITDSYGCTKEQGSIPRVKVAWTSAFRGQSPRAIQDPRYRQGPWGATV